MYKTILIPLDRSAFAEQALPYALGLARAAGASIHLVEAHALPGFGPEHELSSGIFEEVDSQIRLTESNYLENLAAQLASDGGVPVWPRLLNGAVDAAINDYASSARADLIVMSTHGEGGVKRAWLGSVTDALVRHATVPLLLIRPTVAGLRSAAQGEQSSTLTEASEPSSIVPVDFQHLVIAVDGSQVAEEAADRAAELALLMGAHFTLLTVVKPPLYASSAYLPHVVEANREELAVREAEATTYIQTLAPRYSQRGLHVDERIVVDYHPADAILREAGDLGGDLIVVGTRGRGGVQRMVLGSVADKVIRATSLPVFVLPPHAVSKEHAPTDARSGTLVI